MKSLADCEECRAILDEFRSSLDEVERLRSEAGTDVETLQRWLAEGNEGWPPLELQQEGTDSLEALHNVLHDPPFASRFSNPRCPKFAGAMQRMLAHYQRSGHWISVRALLT